jgi:hypothetical protein
MKLPTAKVGTEQDLVRSLSVPARRWLYWRIYAADFHAPPDEAVDQFVALIKTVPANSWLHFHCAGGDGRTTTFMTMADMMRNAKTTAYDVILRRQESLPGAVDFGGYCKTAAWKRSWARERDWFIELFYAYCKQQSPSFEQKFSSWKAQHSNEVPRPPACANEASPSS